MADANARLKFLWTASHSLLASCPAVSSHLMSQFLALASDRDLRLHEDIQARACAGCGSIFAPGLNARVRIVPSQDKMMEKQQRKKGRQRQCSMAAKDAPQKDGSDGHEPVEQANLEDKMDVDVDAGANSGSAEATTTATKQQEDQKPLSKAKIIRLVPWTELHKQEAQRQHQQQQLRRRRSGMAQEQASKKERQAKVRAKRALKKQKKQVNHLHYTCLRCKRVTEMPGATRGQIANMVEQAKPKKASQPQATGTLPLVQQNQGSLAASSKSGLPKTSNQLKQVAPPARAGSTKTSATSSPASTPPPSTLQPGGAEKLNRKKKKNNLASLLANQKSRGNPPPSTPPSGSGDSVLANFLAGL